MNYIPNTAAQAKQMLKSAGVSSIPALFSDIPAILEKPLDLPKGLSELEIRKLLDSIAKRNAQLTIFRGAGAYNHYVPAVVDHILSRSEFFTAYTPYQAETSQGMLQAIYEYQSMICRLTGMDITNASMYDGASALAEAVKMAGKKILVSKAVDPEYRKVLKTYADSGNLIVHEIDTKDGLTVVPKENADCIIIQCPNFFGQIEDISKFKKEGRVLIQVTTDPTAFGLLKSPGELGVDIFVGEGQCFGMPLSFGGPYLGIIACKEKFKRQIPGRIAGATTDNKGNRGYVLTLQAREQHIRRDKAMCNICSNEALCALAATVYLAAVGPNLAKIAGNSHRSASYLYKKMLDLPMFEAVFDSHFYNEFVVKCDNPALVNQVLIENGILGGYELERDYPEMKGCMLFCVTENNTEHEIKMLLNSLEVL